MKHINRSLKSGFTLIELLTVIAIIGILAAILVPSVNTVRERAAQAVSASNLRQIHIAFSNFQIDGSRTRKIVRDAWQKTKPDNASSAGDFAKVLAWYSNLNDPALYYIGVAEDAPNTPPSAILTGTGNARVVDSTFKAAESSISYSMAIVSGNAPNTTPLVWTKGLDTNGNWATTSPWGGKGGHIVFLGGNVEYFRSVPTGGLRGVATTATKNIKTAVGGNSKILDPPAPKS